MVRTRGNSIRVGFAALAAMFSFQLPLSAQTLGPVPDKLNVGKYAGSTDRSALLAQLAKQERQKQIVYDFFNRCMTERDFACVRSYITDNYIQHDPTMEDGVEGMRKMIDEIRMRRARGNYIILRAISEGDYVLLHYSWGDPKHPLGIATSIFRFEGDKLAEHWDVNQELPQPPANSNGMFWRKGEEK